MKNLSLYLLGLGAFLTGTAELVVAGILNIIANDLNISIALAGQLITAYSLAFAIGTPILVSLTSRMERKKLIIISLIVFIIGSLISYISSGYFILMVSRIILGLSAGVYQVVALSSAAKLVPAEKVGSAIGIIALGFGSAIALGVPIGVAISNLWSWPVIFIILGVFSLLILLGLIRLLPKIEGDARVPFLKQFSVLSNPIIVSGFLATLFMTTSNSIMLTYITPFLQNILHLTPSKISWMMLVFGVCSVIGSRYGGAGVDKWGTTKIISFSLLISSISLAFLPLLSTLMVIGLLLLSIWMFSIFVTGTAIQTYFIQEAPRSTNLVLSLNTSFVHLGTAVGAAAGGLIVRNTFTVLYNPWVASGTIILSLVIAFVSFSLRGKRASKIA
ncbi:MFS transporter [Bacillus haynesii]|uniref:MFS transporter n=1 Tax=Bacillus haynesii TaxID=1925021 RepID=A0ABX3HXB2_9BACI|nr:MFS transporter [Bacillus haynesii]OMI24531.1 MFS transporter [Bacillus haynesii]